MVGAISYFELYGLQVSFDVDLKVLNRNYHRLLRQVHPDNFVNATNHERLKSVQLATEINAGYKTLKSPLNRARYLLEMAGVEFGDDEQTEMDPDVLMEQFEFREKLNQIADTPNASVAVETLLADIEARQQALERELARQFTSSEPDYQGAHMNYTTLTFFSRLKEDARRVLLNSDAA